MKILSLLKCDLEISKCETPYTSTISPLNQLYYVVKIWKEVRVGLFCNSFFDSVYYIFIPCFLLCFGWYASYDNRSDLVE